MRQEVTSNLHSVCMDREGELGALVSQLLEKVNTRRAVQIEFDSSRVFCNLDSRETDQGTKRFRPSILRPSTTRPEP